MVTIELDMHDSGNSPVRIVEGQTRPLRFRLSLLKHEANSSDIAVQYHLDKNSGVELSSTFKLTIHHASLHHPHKTTHLHPNGIVSYSMLRAPSINATCINGDKPAPAIVFLHGAGVEADSSIVRNTFDSLLDLCAWIISPSGVTTWSGDDWRK